MIEVGSVLLSAVLMVALIGLLQLTVLVFRNPYRPAWLRTSTAETWTTIAGVSLFSLSLCYQIASLIAAGLPTLFAIAGVPVFVVTVAVLMWRRSRCGDRLRRADAGLSPFDGSPLRRLSLIGGLLKPTISPQSDRR